MLPDNPSNVQGITPTERYLARLCRHSFLRLWSYPNLFRDQKTGGKGDGKELCDLLVAFENDLIIFSDKDCRFPETASVKTSWARWYRRAILKSAQQLWGAERWLREYPARVFLDRGCKMPLPISLSGDKAVRIHEVVVANGAGNACRSHFQSSGTFLIDSHLVGEQHCDTNAKGFVPFCVGRVDVSKRFVHILDEESIGIVLSSLDTVTDFLGYLSTREALLTERKVIASGEENLLAYYLTHMTGEKHSFNFPPEVDGIFLDEGFWPRYQSSAQRRAKNAADKISYVWDSLIERLTASFLYINDDKQRLRAEMALRFMAREPRLRRRMLSKAITDLVHQATGMYRTVQPTSPGDPHYVFITFPKPSYAARDQYIEVRRQHLIDYCLLTLHRFPEATQVVGIATEAGLAGQVSEDLALITRAETTPEQIADAATFCSTIGLRANASDLNVRLGNEQEFPRPARLPEHWRIRPPRVGRNDPCPCGSGRKFKKCCIG